MRFWFVHSGEVSLREQICTQVMLGIAGGELRAGQRLPSTREMARRFGLHPNTVSAAYQQLQRSGHLQRRHGAGVFVRAATEQSVAAQNGQGDREEALDRLIRQLLATVRIAGFGAEEVLARVAHWTALRPPDHFLLVEPDEDRREILLAELAAALTLPVRACGLDRCADAAGAVALARPSEAA